MHLSNFKYKNIPITPSPHINNQFEKKSNASIIENPTFGLNI